MSKNQTLSQFHNLTSISPELMAATPGKACLIDVRKPKARAASWVQIPGSVWRHPFAAAGWAGDYKDRAVVVYCVHGHEVSQAVRGYLADCGVEAAFVSGGIEAWIAAGLPVEALEAGHD